MKINDININYIQYGEGPDIVLLHGWGQNIEMMMPLGNQFKDCFKITILDLPGFGKSDEPSCGITIFEYNKILEEFLIRLKITNPIIIGHSFGGRLGIIYASLNPVSKLVLFGSPCIRENNKMSLKTKTLKTLKKVPLLGNFSEYFKRHIGSEDYKNASIVMREILVNTINTDLSANACKIKCPTLLLWGENDTAAPLELAKKLEQLIKDAALITFPNFGHYLYLENMNPIVNILNNFF
ncbi:MAG: alpha/beta hydrolase [Bacilli bacterium]